MIKDLKHHEHMWAYMLAEDKNYDILSSSLIIIISYGITT